MHYEIEMIFTVNKINFDRNKYKKQDFCNTLMRLVLLKAINADNGVVCPSSKLRCRIFLTLGW